MRIMEIKLNSISNPGISFTDDVNQKIILLYNYINKNREKKISYSDFQAELINEKIFSGSYIRSFIPFLRNFGVVNDYSNIDFNTFFTRNGKIYVNNIIDYYKLKDFEDENIIIKKVKNIKEDLICLFLDYLCDHKNKYYEKYLDILFFIEKYNKICKKEFYIYEYCKENNLESDELISAYRQNLENFEIIFYGKNNNEIGNNAFNYFIALLSEDQCNYVLKMDQNYYKLNENRKELVDSIIKNYIY